jgi:thioesterase domain-containing protein/acyl carrier protein
LPDPDVSGSLSNGYVAPRTAVEQQLASIWQELLGVTRVGIHDDFFELGGHSLLVMVLVNKINKTFSTSHLISLVFKYPTIALIANILQANEHTDESLLIKMKSGNDVAPLFCIHPAGGSHLSFRMLSDVWKGDQSVYAFEARGLDGKSEPIRSVEEMAGNYIKEMRRIQPNGPYKLLGYSFGASVALEMALQLKEQGHHAEKLVIVDAANPLLTKDESFEDDYKKAFISQIEKSINVKELGVDSLEKEFENKSRAEILDLVNRKIIENEIVDTPDSVIGFFNVFATNSSMPYTPQISAPLDSQIILLKANETVKFIKSMDTEINNNAISDLDYGWQEITSEKVVSYHVDGTHENILDMPSVEKVARLIHNHW